MADQPKPRPSRKGVPITPHKGGRTRRFPDARLTQSELEMLEKILKQRNQSVADWVVTHIKEDYEKLV